MLNRPDIDVKKYLPYVSNVKAAAGIGMVLFALYTGCMDIPPKWGTYNTSRTHKDELIQNKNSLRAEETKLNKISKELDKNPIRLVLVPQGAAPDLTLIKIAQKVIELSETTGNTYLTLQPGSNTMVDVNSIVTLPINIPGQGGAPGASPEGGATPGAPTPAAPGMPTPGMPGGTPDWTTGALGAYPYTLTIMGSYPTLSKFVQELSKMQEFLVISSISLDPGTMAGHPDSDEIVMKMEFAVPWKPGTPPPDQGQSVKPAAVEDSAEGATDTATPEKADNKKAEPAKADPAKKPADDKAAKPAEPTKTKAEATQAKPVKTAEAAPKPAKVVSPAENGRPAKRKAG